MNAFYDYMLLLSFAAFMRANPENQWLSSIVATVVISMAWVGLVPIVRLMLTHQEPTLGQNVVLATVSILFALTVADVWGDFKKWMRGKFRTGTGMATTR